MATATESNVLEAQPRTPGNKNVARRVRQGGKIPGVLYGAGKQSLTCDSRSSPGDADSPFRRPATTPFSISRSKAERAPRP